MKTAKGIIIFLIAALAIPAQAQLGKPSTSRDQVTGKKQSEAAVPFSTAKPEDITNENYPELIESFDYPNADITEVVKAISKLTGKNFILDNNVRGKITIIAPTQITAAEAYRAFLSALAINGLTVVPSGKFLKIRDTRSAMRDSIDTYAGSYFPNTDQLITRIIKLKYISAAEVQKSLRMVTSKSGEMNPYPPTNSLIISDFGSHIERVQNILNQLDVPGFEEKMAVIRIRYAKAKDIADMIDQIINKGQGGKGRFGSSVPRFRRSKTAGTSSGGSGAESFSLVVSDERTNSVIVVGNQAGIEKIKSLVRKLDFKLRPEDAGGVYVYYVRHGEAEQIANVLNGIADEAKKGSTPSKGGSSSSKKGAAPAAQSGAIFGGDVKVAADKVTNSLIVTASKPDYQVVKSLLSKIDIARDQVFVKTIIMEMSAAKDTQWGIDYYQFEDGTDGAGRIGFRGTNNLNSLITPAGDSGAILGFGRGDNTTIKVAGESFTVKSLTGLVKFLKKNVGANILSTPQLTALDNEEAEIEVGQTIPVGKSDATTGSTVTSSIQREKATIKLKITPFVSPDSENVRLKIDQQIKQATREQVQASELQNAAVVTNDRNIKTMINVDSGDTAVLGGLMSDQEDQEVVKVPVLGDIPILGWLFKSKKVSKKKRNLLVFITPKIIRNNQDNADLLDQKLNERIDFIQRAMNGRDPFGAEVDGLPRKANASQETIEEPGFEEEPATETF